MKNAFIYTVLLLLIVFSISCKKDHSYEGGSDNKNNKPPIAVAGPDQVITLPIDSVLLDGSSSSDPDGMISSYLWTKISGPVSFNIIKPADSITRVKTLMAGTYLFELKITDNGGLSAKDTMQVIVNTAIVVSSLGCNASMQVIDHLPTPGGVKYSVTVGTKILFIRYPGEVNIYDTVTYTWETVNGMYATSYYLPSQTGYKTAIVGKKIIFSVMANSLDTSQGQLINIYDAGSNSWSITHLPQARSFYAMAVVGTKVFYAGGNTDSKKMDIYDAGSNSWSTANFSNARRNVMTAASLGNKIFFAGGFVARYDSLVLECDDYGNNCDSVPAIVGSDRVDIFDVSTNSWSEAQLSEGRGFISKAIIGNKIFFIGGEKLPGNYSHKVDVYDMSNNSWSSTDLEQYYGNEEVYGAYTVGSKLLLPGNDNIHIYDAAANNWSIVQMPFPHQSDMAERGLVASVGNKLLFFVQYNDLYHSKGIDIYDATTNTWCHTQLNFDLIRTGMVAVGNRIYIAGGITMIGCCIYNNPINTVWHFNF